MYLHVNNNIYSKICNEDDLSWSSSVSMKVQEITQLRYAGLNYGLLSVTEVV
jgi:hypothetical protein